MKEINTYIYEGPARSIFAFATSCIEDNTGEAAAAAAAAVLAARRQQVGCTRCCSQYTAGAAVPAAKTQQLLERYIPTLLAGHARICFFKYTRYSHVRRTGAAPVFPKDYEGGSAGRLSLWRCLLLNPSYIGATYSLMENRL